MDNLTAYEHLDPQSPEYKLSGLNVSFKKGSAPAPDYKGAAQEEAAASKEITTQQTWANRPTQYNPWGSTSWESSATIDPSTGQPVTSWTQYENLSPQAQQALDSQMALQTGKSDLAGGMMGRVGQEIGNEMDWSKFGPMTGVGNQRTMQDPANWNQTAYDNTYAMADRKLAPQFAKEKEQMEIKLRNQGLRVGDQAYDDAMGGIDTRQTDAYQSAMMGAQDKSGSEAQRMQSMERSGLGFNQDTMYRQSDQANQLRQQAIKEEMTKRGFSLNEMNALLSGQQVANPNFESFNPASKSDTPQYMQAAVNQGNFDQQKAASEAGGMGDMAGLAMSGAMMMSDRRLKRNIKRIGTVLGYPLYIFDYVWGKTAIGFMSDEVNQDAVSVHPSGFDWINLNLVREK